MIDLKLLYPEFTFRLREFVLHANYQGMIVDVQQAYRSIEEQDALYAQGRTTAGSVVTNAQGGHSWHNWGLAADVVFKDKKGKWTWDVKLPWDQLSVLGKQFTLEWGGDFKSIKDVPHFQLTGGLTIEEAIEIGNKEDVWKEVGKRLGI